MESAYIFMFATFGIAGALGAITRSNWIAVGVPMLIPFLFIASRLKGPGLGETLLFVSPFLVAGAIIYGVVSYAGVSAGRKLRSMFTNRHSGVQEDDE